MAEKTVERYMNGKSKRIAVIVHRNNANDVISLKYEDGNGVATVSTTTLKKCWKKVKDDVPSQSVESSAESDTSKEVAGDGTSYSQVLSEIVEDEKKAAKKAAESKSKSAKTPKKASKPEKKADKSDKVKKSDLIEQHLSTIISILGEYEGFSYRIRPRTPFLLVVNYKEDTFFEVRSTKEGATFSCRVVDVPDGLEYKEYRYYRPASIKVYDDYADALRSIIDKKIKEEK